MIMNKAESSLFDKPMVFLRKHFEISIQSGEQSLIINHEKSTTFKQDALKLPKIKTEKGRR